jgi:hypothetical protein
MSSTNSEVADRSLLEQCHWLLVGQYDATPADRLRNAFVLIGFATSFLSFVGATTAVLRAPNQWWLPVGLAVLGLGALLFAWQLAMGSFAGLFGSTTPEDAT